MLMRSILILLTLFTSLSIFGQQTYSGRISSDMRWSGVVTVDGDLTIPPNITLTVDPGTRVNITATADKTKSGEDPNRVEIVVLGNILVNGSEGPGKVTFTSTAADPKMNDWYGIIIKNPNKRSLVNNAIIEYAYKGITCYGSSPNIIDCELRYNQHCGISAEVRAVPLIRRTTLLGNDFAGLICELASTPIIEESIITQNGNGLIVFDRSQPDLGQVNPSGTQSSGGNLIFNNFDYSIYNQSSEPILAQNNLWNTRDEEQIKATIFDRTISPSKGEVMVQPILGEQIASNEAAEAQITPASNTVRNRSNAGYQRSKPAETKKPVAESASARARARAQQNNSRNQASARKTSVQRKNNAKSDTQARKTTPPAQKPANDTDTRLAAASGTNNAVTPAASEQPTGPATQPAAANRNSGNVNRVTTRQNNNTVQRLNEPKVVEPVMETLIDGGGRQYIKKVIPKYPDIYRRTSFEGKVLMEVIVGRDGKVEKHRILRSDGEHFAAAAESAIQQFRYKPATFRGKPIKFKIVEPFIFRLK